MKKKESIILVGCKGSGKSTQGKKLAEQLGYEFYDTDLIIKEISGMTPRDLYKIQGVKAFKIAETQASELIKSMSAEKNMVVASGGGVCDNPDAMALLKDSGILVHIKVPTKFAVSRCMNKIKINEKGEFENVPSFIKLKGNDSMFSISKSLFNCLKFRAEKYTYYADVTVDIKKASKKQAYESILKAVKKFIK